MGCQSEPMPNRAGLASDRTSNVGHAGQGVAGGWTGPVPNRVVAVTRAPAGSKISAAAQKQTVARLTRPDNRICRALSAGLGPVTLARPPAGRSWNQREGVRKVNTIEAMNVAVVRRYFEEACNTGDVADLMATMTPDVVHYFLPTTFPPALRPTLPVTASLWLISCLSTPPVSARSSPAACLVSTCWPTCRQHASCCSS
jgi:hypothetical protein